MAIGITDACPNIQATVVDLPATIIQTRKLLDAFGAIDRVGVQSANIVEAPCSGTYDLAVLRNFIQVLSPDHAQSALNHVSQSMEPGGSLFILGAILDDYRTGPSIAVKSNLNFLNVYDEGRAYTEGEYRGWLKEAGFKSIDRVVVQDGTSVIQTTKGTWRT